MSKLREASILLIGYTQLVNVNRSHVDDLNERSPWIELDAPLCTVDSMRVTRGGRKKETERTRKSRKDREREREGLVVWWGQGAAGLTGGSGTGKDYIDH